MANLIKRDGSPFWIATFDVTMSDGSVRRLKKSTKRKKRSEAMDKAIELEAAAKREHTADNDTAKKAFSILTEAAEAAAKGELSEARARTLIARLTEISTGEELKFFTLAEWRDEWLALKAATSKPATLARYKGHVDAFIEWMGDKANSRLEAVTKSDVRAFRDALRIGWIPGERVPDPESSADSPRTLRTAKTVNLYAADVASMFRRATRDGLLISNPAAALERLPELDSSERSVFSVAEVGKLVETAGEAGWQDGLFAVGDPQRDQRSIDWQGMVLAGFYAGARLGDCARMKWGNVNLSRKSITFMPAKTERKRKRIEVPIHPRLFVWLKDRAAGNDEEPLFPSLHGCHIGGGHGLSSQFIAIMEDAKIDRHTSRKGESGRQRAQHGRSFHALRHSLTSTLANLDVSEEIRRRIVGHESSEVHAGYTHHERETIARAMEKMPNV